jgi:hypothetical protein
MATTPQKPPAEQPRSAEQQQLIKDLERLKGRKLSEQEANLSLKQARAIGEL